MSESTWTESGSRRRVITTAIVAVVVVVIGLAVAATVVSARPAAQPAEAATERFAAPAAPGASTSMLFVGDSFTLGPPSLPDLGYACLTATRLGMNCNLGAQPGTGYINGGPDHRLPLAPGTEHSTSYYERIPRLHARMAADVVVFDGGRNDLAYDREFLANALLFTLERAADAWPNARIVVIPPWYLIDPDTAAATMDAEYAVAELVRDRVGADPALGNVIVLDPPPAEFRTRSGLAETGEADGIHLSPAQHRRVAEWLSSALLADGIGVRQ